jgi:hypothetical protein
MFYGMFSIFLPSSTGVDSREVYIEFLSNLSNIEKKASLVLKKMSLISRKFHKSLYFSAI